MHVLLCINSYVTPADPIDGEKFRVQARALAERGQRVGVLAVRQRGGAPGPPLGTGAWLERGLDEGIPVYRDHAWRALPRAGKVPRDVDARMRCAGALRSFLEYVADRGRPDVVHAHGVKWAGSVGALIRRQLGVPLVLTEHTSIFARNRVHDWQEPLFREAFERADARTVVSPAAGRALERALGAAARPWTAVPNLVDLERFAVSPPPDPAEGFGFLCLGRLSPVKGHADLIDAFARAFGGAGDVRLRIAGDGEERASLEARARRRDVAEQVSFLGALARDAVAAEIARSHALVVPSHFETFGIPVIEATACGRPVVATTCGGPDDLVDDENGLLVRPRHPRGLARALVQLREAYPRYDPERIAAACRTRFAPGAVLDRYDQVYRDAASTSS